MLSLTDLDQAITESMKSRDQVKTDTLRGLKTRLHNEQIAVAGELSDAQILIVVRSELKRRKEAADSYRSGGRAELADKEQQEAAILQAFLPPQISVDDLAQQVAQEIIAQNWTSKDFGTAMKALKDKFGDQTDGATLSKILKEQLK